jgi:hypothetical protein
VIELQSACTLLYAVLDSPPFRSTTDQSLVSAQQSLLSSILTSNVTDSHIMMRQAQCLVLFHEILAQTPMVIPFFVFFLVFIFPGFACCRREASLDEWIRSGKWSG